MIDRPINKFPLAFLFFLKAQTVLLLFFVTIFLVTVPTSQAFLLSSTTRNNIIQFQKIPIASFNVHPVIESSRTTKSTIKFGHQNPTVSKLFIGKSNKNYLHFLALQSRQDQGDRDTVTRNLSGRLSVLPLILLSLVNMTINSINKIHVALFVFYWIGFGNIFVPLLLLSSSNTNLCLMVLATIWLGFVLAISGMEAWLKFRAPFCPRPFALDIGRTIFPALNAVELALCLSCWQYTMKKSNGVGLVSYNYSISLILVTVILLLDVVWLTPKLVRRGKQVVYQHLKKHHHHQQQQQQQGNRNTQNSLEFQALAAEMETQPMAKQDKWHVVYVLLEFIKMIGLGRFLSCHAAAVVATAGL